MSLGGNGHAATIPISGGNGRWIVNAEAYKEGIKSRLISYSAADKVVLESFDQVYITPERGVELITD